MVLCHLKLTRYTKVTLWDDANGFQKNNTAVQVKLWVAIQ